MKLTEFRDFLFNFEFTLGHFPLNFLDLCPFSERFLPLLVNLYLKIWIFISITSKKANLNFNIKISMKNIINSPLGIFEDIEFSSQSDDNASGINKSSCIKRQHKNRFKKIRMMGKYTFFFCYYHI